MPEKGPASKAMGHGCKNTFLWDILSCRSFELAQLAKAYGDNVPEYRFEYEDIVTQCKLLSSELLNQCNESKEVHELLNMKSGVTKYFRYSDQMKYPILRLAIEHNNKPFVGHMYCQNTLRQSWYGDSLWQGAPIGFKLLMFLLHILMAPGYAIQVSFPLFLSLQYQSFSEIHTLAFQSC